MPISKPDSVAMDPAMSEKWDELTEGREFSPRDVPALKRLCSWYLIAERCLDDMTTSNGYQVAYTVKDGIAELPQVGTLAKAENAIRGIEKSLGIFGQDSPAPTEAEDASDDGGADVLTLVRGRGPAARRAI